MKLVIVESPSKAKTIAKYLGSEYVVRPTVGHIVDLSKGRSGIGVNIANGFVPTYEDIADKKDVISAIVLSAKSASEIIIASDPDREGEAIAFHVMSKIKDDSKVIRRAEFHEITKNGIKKGLDSLRDLDQNVYDAQQARRVLDRIVGFIVSPYLAQKFDQNLSAGRVQSVALRLIVDREREIEAFNAENYWTIAVNVKGSNGEFLTNYPSKLSSEKEADELKAFLDAASYVVEEVSAKEQKRNPPTPLNTADLQKAASAKFKFSADQTMKVAQNLYEIGSVSYIRSDSYRSSPESIEEVRQYLTAQGFGVPAQPNVHKNKDATQDAHEAIRPTDVNLTPNLFSGTPEQAKIYTLIWERFVASQMLPALYDTVSLTIKATQNSKSKFLKSNGRTLKYKGWLELIEDTEKSDHKDNVLPIVKEQEKMALIKVLVDKKTTKAPNRFNDGSMIDELKKNAIGRPATYAAILGKLSTKKYVTKIKNNYHPTDIGKDVVDTLSKHFSFMNYDYTALMEEKLDLIAAGKADYLQVMTEFYDVFKEEFQKTRNSEAKSAGVNCPICDSPMTVRHSQFGFFAGCIKYPVCKGVVGVRLEGEEVVIQPTHERFSDVLCPKCNCEMVRRDGKYGPFYSCSDYPRCQGKRKIPFGKKCSKCKVGELYVTMFKDEQKLACMRYPECHNIEPIPDGAQTNWVKPETIIPVELPKKFERILKKKIKTKEE